MKVGFLVSSVSREAGGLFQSVRGLAKAVTVGDATVQIFGIRDNSTAADSPKWQPFAVHAFPPVFRPWGYSSHLLPALVGADLDILQTHGLWKYSSLASVRWHAQTGRPYVVHPHGMLDSWALKNSRWKKRIGALLYEDRHLQGAACLRALCEAEVESIRAYGLRNPICIIPNGVELPELVESWTLNVKSSAIQTVARDQKILLYLGRLHPKKNLANLIRAWKEALDSQPSTSNSWALAVAGWEQRGYAGKLKKLTTDYGLPTTVKFLGPLFGDEREAAYRACDAFVLPSLSEGLPMTVLEAWAYAKPVLMTPECNLPQGFTAGAALPVGASVENIAGGLRQLLEMSDGDRKAMGARGRALVAERFSWPKIGEAMIRVCEWLLGGGPPPETVRP